MAVTNVKYSVKANKLIIEVDFSAAALAKAKPSASGKTLVVASTGGFVQIDGTNLSMGLNITGKPG